MNGYYIYTSKVDYFFTTDIKIKSKNLLQKVANILTEILGRGISAEQVKYNLEKATYRQKYINNKLVHCIEGEGFSYGDFEENKHCEIINVN